MPRKCDGQGSLRQPKMSAKIEDLQIVWHVNVVLGSNSATRTPNVVNACLETFLTIFEAHGTHSPASVNEENINDVDTKDLNFRTLFTPARNGVDVVVPVESIRAISERFANTAYGFFLGKWVAYPVVANYVRNTWDKYELVKYMLNSSTKIFSFQFNYIDGLDAVLENGPWSSYARALIEVRVDVELKDDIVVPMPKLVGEGFYTCTVRVAYE
ncbi:zinc knuckle CX2CX4HX4C containing protein [Tanacetum coccineum]